LRKRPSKSILAAGSSLALLVGVGWLGLRIKPAPFPPHPERTPELNTTELPTDLPEPVRRHFRATLGEQILRGSDAYLGGEGSLETTGLLNTSSRGETFVQGQNLAMWAEAPFTTPPVLVLDPRSRWEPIDAHTARLVVPFGEREQTLRAEFDLENGLMTSMCGMRYRNREKTKTPWRGEFSEWRTLRGIQTPRRNAAIWEDQREPYGIFEIEGTEYNVDVSDKISSESLEA
jgi:hypothetical protein